MSAANQKIQQLNSHLNKNSTGYFDKNKFNSFESLAVMFESYIEGISEEESYMLAYPISDLGIVNKDEEPFKVFLSDKATGKAKSIKEKCRFAEAGKTAFILDRVSKNKNGDIEAGWLNTVSRDYDSTVLSGVTFIRECEKQVSEDGSIVDAMINNGGRWVPKNKMSVFTMFPQFSVQLEHSDQIKPFLQELINNSSKGIKTGYTSAAVRVSTDDGKSAALFEFSGKKNAQEDYRDYSWDELKEMPDMQKKYAYLINSVHDFMQKAEDGSQKVILEIMPALLHYPGRYTAENKASLSNKTNYENYFLMTDDLTTDQNGKEMPLVLNGGRESFVGVELKSHSITKVLPVNFNTPTNEFGFNKPSDSGKTLIQLKKEATSQPSPM